MALRGLMHTPLLPDVKNCQITGNLRNVVETVINGDGRKTAEPTEPSESTTRLDIIAANTFKLSCTTQSLFW